MCDLSAKRWLHFFSWRDGFYQKNTNPCRLHEWFSVWFPDDRIQRLSLSPSALFFRFYTSCITGAEVRGSDDFGHAQNVAAVSSSHVWNLKIFLRCRCKMSVAKTTSKPALLIIVEQLNLPKFPTQYTTFSTNFTTERKFLWKLFTPGDPFVHIVPMKIATP